MSFVSCFAENVCMMNVSYTYDCLKTHWSLSVCGAYGGQKTQKRTFFCGVAQLKIVRGYAALNAYVCLQICGHYTYFAIGRGRLSTS